MRVPPTPEDEIILRRSFARFTYWYVKRWPKRNTGPDWSSILLRFCGDYFHPNPEGSNHHELSRPLRQVHE